MSNEFDLRFQATDLEPERYLAHPPSMSLSPPGQRALWHLGENGELASIHLSGVLFSLTSIWAWAAAIAHDLLPVTLHSDEEGNHSYLCAEPDPEVGYLRLTLVQMNESFGGIQELRQSLGWRETRVDWLRRLGELFGHHLAEPFDASTWLAEPAWPEPAQFLAWEWPASLAPRVTRYWSPEQARTWFFLLLAHQLNPFILRLAKAPRDQEWFVRLQYRLANLRRDAIVAACRAADNGLHIPVETFEQKRLAVLNLLSDLDLVSRCSYYDLPEEIQPLADIRTRRRVLQTATFAMESTLYTLLNRVSERLFPRLPLTPGQWLMDERFRPGRIIRVMGERMIIDWGDVGITTEYGLGCGQRSTWRWPIAEPPHFVFPADPLFQRWRLFAISLPTRDYWICPCCAYPHLDQEPAKLIDCLICGWPLYRLPYEPLPDPDEPYIAANQQNPGLTLRKARQHFVRHGDAFAPEDAQRAARVRNPTIAPLRPLVIEAFDKWLADPERNIKRIPHDAWQQLMDAS